MLRRVGRLLSVTGGTGSAVASVAASICCLGPVGIGLLGVQGAILAAGIRPYRLYLLGGSLLLLGAAFWSVYGGAIGRPGRCAVRTGRWVRRTLWASLGVWVFAVVMQIVADYYWF